MPVVLVFDSDYPEEVAQVAQELVNDCGYQTATKGYSPSSGHPGSIHWPMESDLPTNVLLHPDRSPSEAYQEAMNVASFKGYRLERVVAFEVGKWSGAVSRFEDKPAKNWEDFPRGNA